MTKNTDPLKLSICLASALLICALSSCSPSASTQQQPKPSPTQPPADLIAQADKLYSQREDLKRVREAITLLRQVRASDQNNYEAAWRLAKFNYYLGSHTEEQNERDAAFREGVEDGQAAVKLQGSKPEGHFWLGANYGGQARLSAIAGLASIEDIRNEMETVVRLDESYQAGSAHMALCQLYLEAPKI